MAENASYSGEQSLVVSGTTPSPLNLTLIGTHQIIEEPAEFKAFLESSQFDWIGGHGQLRKADLTRYLKGQSIDTTQKGRAFQGPLINTVPIAVPVSGAIAGDAAVFTDETAAAINTTVNDMTLLPAVPEVNDAYYFFYSTAFNAVVVRIGTAGAGVWTVVWEYYDSGTSTWTALAGVSDGTVGFTAAAGDKSVTFTKPATMGSVTVGAVTGYAVRARVSSYTSIVTQPKGTRAWVSDSAFTLNTKPGSGTYTAREMCWFGTVSNLVVSATQDVTATTYSSDIYIWNGTHLIWKTGAIAAKISSLCEFNGVLYVAIGAGAAYYYSTDGEVYTNTDLASDRAVKFYAGLTAAGTSNVLWKGKTPNEIASTTDGRTVAAGGQAYSSIVYIGDTSTNLTNIFSIGKDLGIGKTDNFFTYDAGGAVRPRMKELMNARGTDNFKYVLMWGTSVYASLINGTLMEITNYNNTDQTFDIDYVGPLDDNDDIGKIGTVVGLTNDRDCLYCSTLEGTAYQIYKGKMVTDERGTRWGWCSWIYLGTNATEVCFAASHSTTDRRLWFGYGSGVAYAIITDNPTTDTAARFCPASVLQISYEYGSNPYWDKMFQYIITETKGCAAGITITPKYLKDTDTSSTALTAAITTNGVVKTELAAALSCNRISFELNFATNDSTKTAEISFFRAFGTEKPKVIGRIHDCTYRIGDMPTQRVKTIEDFFNTARASTVMIKFADHRFRETTATAGAYHWVTILPGYPKMTEILNEVTRAPELALNVRFLELSFTAS